MVSSAHDDASNEGGISGVGIGLRFPHLPEILTKKPPVPWFEVLTENFFGLGGASVKRLEEVRALYPVVFHCVGMSLGSSDEMNMKYFKRLLELKLRFQPAWISDHLCWSSIDGRYLHDLLPLPYTREALDSVVSRINQVQDFLQQTLLIENVSSYLNFQASEMSESQFLNAVLARSGCSLLLDVNNVFVNSRNHGFSAEEYIANLPSGAVKQLHIAGHLEQDGMLIDTHSELVSEEVWKLLKHTVACHGNIPTSIEWDQDIPEFSVLVSESEKARAILEMGDRML